MYDEHYEKYLDVYKIISKVNNGKTVWIPTDSHSGWYVDSTADEGSVGWEDGYPKQSRPQILPDDLSSDVERTAYTTISYCDDDSYTTRYYKNLDDGIEWYDDSKSRLPDYGDMNAWAIFVDIDIKDDYKKRPLPEEHKEIIQNRLSLWFDAFEQMSGSKNSVLSLDSGGGVYVFIPPTGLAPVADKYDKEDLNLIFNEIGKRVRSVVGKLNNLICSQDDAPDEIFSADKVQNKNRQFKTIGSIHKSLDAVVHPIDTEDIKINHKKVEDIADDDIKEAEEWANSFVSDRHRECVDSIIKYLFQGSFTEREDMDINYIEGDSWEDILDNWLEDKKESIRVWQTDLENRKEMDNIDVDITQDKDVAKESLRRVNNKKLKKYIIDYLGEDKVYDKTGSEMDLFPFWRSETTETGRSAFYDEYKGKALFTDKADGTSRDIVYWVALEVTYSDKYDEEYIKSPGDDLTKEQYAKCVDILRERGENIPILVKDVDEDEELPIWDMKKVGVNKDILEEDSEQIPTDKWNEIIDILNDNDITHNRSKKNYIRVDDITPSIKGEQSREEAYNKLFNNMGYYKDEFESKKEYNKILNNLPNDVVVFDYNGEINGNKPSSIVAGVFSHQNEDTIYLTYFEPMIINNYKYIDSLDDLTVEDINEELDKDKITIYQPSDSTS